MIKKIVLIFLFLSVSLFNFPVFADDNLDSKDFVITVSDISPWMTDFDFASIIGKMLIGIGILALFTMTIWSGYMIFYHWHDEYLSKWKTIFTAWITALVVALCSYYLVSLVRYILYN